MKTTLALVISLLICYAVAAGGSVFTATSVRDWYPTLIKPSWTPPSWLFGPVWTLLYTMMAVAAWLVWRRHGEAPVGLALGIFGVQLALNFAWSLLFFGLHRPDLAMLDIVALWLSILATIIIFYRLSTLAALLLIPYLLWVTFASALNYALWHLNR